MRVPRLGQGRPRTRPDRVRADKAYGSRANRAYLRKRELADLVIGRAGATTLAELETLRKPAVLIPLPASVSRGDQLDNATAYARRATCIVVPDDDLLADGRPITAACEQLLPHLQAASPHPDPDTIRRTARNIAARTLRLARPGKHRTA